MNVEDEWWRTEINEGEDVLWVGRPYQGYFPPLYGWAYKVSAAGLIIMWLFSPWLLDTARDYWKLACVSALLGFAIWADRLVRSRKVYVVTSEYARKFTKDLKSKKLKIDQFLNFRTGRRAVLFSRHPFFAFEHLPDPDAALQALNQAREACK